MIYWHMNSKVVSAGCAKWKQCTYCFSFGAFGSVYVILPTAHDSTFIWLVQTVCTQQYSCIMRAVPGSLVRLMTAGNWHPLRPRAWESPWHSRSLNHWFGKKARTYNLQSCMISEFPRIVLWFDLTQVYLLANKRCTGHDYVVRVPIVIPAEEDE